MTGLIILRSYVDYGCALQREILIQGRLYISENHICFHANIFGWITDVRLTSYLDFPGTSNMNSSSQFLSMK